MPDFSTPVGKMFVLLWTMRQEREFLANRSIVQAIAAGDSNHEAVKSAFNDLANAFNPYLEETRVIEKKKRLDRMLREVNRGALNIIPTGPPIGTTNYGKLRTQFKNSFKDDYRDKSISPLDSKFARRRHR